MKRFWLLLIFIQLIMPISAQDTDTDGMIVFGNQMNNTSVDDFSLSNLYCLSSDCWTMTAAMSLPLIGIDADFGWFERDVEHALVRDWDLSADNRILTLYLKDDLRWSDGTPITSADIMIVYDLLLNPASNPRGRAHTEFVNSTIESVEAPDDSTIIITYYQGSCLAVLQAANILSIEPAHIYRQLIDDVGYTDLRNHDWLEQPDVSAGLYRFDQLGNAYGEVALVRNDALPNTDDLIGTTGFRQVPITYNEMSPEVFLDSEVNVLFTISTLHKQAFLEAGREGRLQVYQAPSDGVGVFAMNTADPSNPQPAIMPNGERIDQGLHPIFGDVKARQAMGYAIDVDQLIEEALSGFAVRANSYLTPSSWAYNTELAPIPYDPQLALERFADAGWVPVDAAQLPSLDNPLICQDCLYATEVDPSYEGTPFEFVLNTTTGRLPLSTLIQEQLAAIGIGVSFDTENFIDQIISQTYDAAILSYFGGLPHDPHNDWFSVTQDVPDQGVNITSYYSEAFFGLSQTALNVQGCGVTERAEIYQRMQAVIRDEMPFVFLYSSTSMVVAKNEIQGFDPRPGNPWHNIEAWRVAEEE